MRWRSGQRRCALLVTVNAALLGSCAEAPAKRASAVTRGLALEGDAAAPLGADADAAEADAALGAGTPAPEGAEGASCCVASSSPGCADAQISACLCQLDPFCCNDQHDALCVREALSSCGLRCEPPPPVSDCCGSSSTPGCIDTPVQSCVCDLDPACCQLRFDQSCVNLAAARCGAACTSEGAP